VIVRREHPADHAAVHAPHVGCLAVEQGGHAQRHVPDVADHAHRPANGQRGERARDVVVDLVLGQVHDRRPGRREVPGGERGGVADVEHDQLAAAAQLLLEGGGVDLGGGGGSVHRQNMLYN